MSDDLVSSGKYLPVVDSIVLSPDPLYSNDTLTAVTFSDVDGQTVTGTYAWYEDGTLTSFTGGIINASELM